MRASDWISESERGGCIVLIALHWSVSLTAVKHIAVMSPFNPLGTELHKEAGLGAVVVGKVPSVPWGSHAGAGLHIVSCRLAGSQVFPPRGGQGHQGWRAGHTWCRISSPESLCPSLPAFPKGRASGGAWGGSFRLEEQPQFPVVCLFVEIPGECVMRNVSAV